MNKILNKVLIENSSNYTGYFILNNKKCFVENSIIGDLIDIEIYKETSKFYFAKIINIIEQTENRITAKCPYYSQCGGCDLQHCCKAYYYNLKLDNLVNLLKTTDLDFSKETIQIFKTEESNRRRINLKYQQGNYGFFKQNSNNIIKVDYCLLLTQEINEIIKLFQKLKFANLDSVDITQADNGIGINLIFNKDSNLKDFEKLNILKEKVISITYSLVNDSMLLGIYKKENLKLNLGDLIIDLPDKCFLQATKISQDFMINIIKNELINYKNVADLYCGIGTYSFPLSKTTKVSAFEGDETMVKYFKQNINKLQLSTNIVKKDLFNQPLIIAELNKFQAVIIDPPRTGAENQIKQLAKSKIDKIIYISCNPNALINDLKYLKDSFEIKAIYLIDQFYLSVHSEVMIILTKTTNKKLI